MINIWLWGAVIMCVIGWFREHSLLVKAMRAIKEAKLQLAGSTTAIDRAQRTLEELAAANEALRAAWLKQREHIAMRTSEGCGGGRPEAVTATAGGSSGDQHAMQCGYCGEFYAGSHDCKAPF